MFFDQSTFLRPLISAKYKRSDQPSFNFFFNHLIEYASFDSENVSIFSCNSSSLNWSVPASLCNHKQSLLNALFESALKGLPTALLLPSLEWNFRWYIL